MQKLTVLVINDFDYVQGGASKVAIDTARLLHEENMEVIFFSGTHNEEESKNYPFKVISVNIPESLQDKNKIRGALRGLYNFKTKKTLKELLDTLDPKSTIIHVHGWTKTLSSSIFSVIFKKKFKMVLTLHDYFTACPNGGFFNYPENKICHLEPLSKKCVCTNCDSRNYGFKIYRVIREFIQNKIVKLPKYLKNVITISDFSLKILKPYLNSSINIYPLYNPIEIPSKKEKINLIKNDYYLFVGRLSKEKGADLFCEAITKLNYKGIVVGDGPEMSFLKEKYPNISFVGWQDKEGVNKYIKNARALIFSSRWYETMGLTVLEAKSYGIPVIISNETAASDFIDKTDLKFLSGNVKDLILKIEFMEKNILKKKITSSYLTKDYSPKIYTENLGKIYQKIMED